jgi:hypothetical protein
MKETDRRTCHEGPCHLAKEKIATVTKAADIPRRTLRDYLLMEIHSKYLEKSRILSEKYFSFIFPATLSISVFGSKAG